MSNIVEIPLRDLVKVMAFRATEEDVRYYLAGINVEPVTEGCMLTATNGHAIATLHSRDSRADKSRILSFTAELEKAVKEHCTREGAEILVTNESARIVVHVEHGGEKYIKPGAAFIDGKFPDWRRVIPSPKQLQPSVTAHVAARYLSLACKPVPKDERYSYLTFWHDSANGDNGPTVVRYSDCPELIVAIMPVRKSTGEVYWPAWMQTGVGGSYEPKETAA